LIAWILRVVWWELDLFVLYCKLKWSKNDSTSWWKINLETISTIICWFVLNLNPLIVCSIKSLMSTKSLFISLI
jgi:hypothetical protein